MSNGTSSKKKKRIIRENGIWGGVEDVTPDQLSGDVIVGVEYRTSECTDEEAEARLAAAGPDFSE